MKNQHNISKSKLSLVLFSLMAAVLVLGSCSRPRKVKDDTGNWIAEHSSDTWTLPEYHEEKLDNGLRILFVPDQRLPYVSMAMFFMMGSEHDPADHQGLTQLTMRLLDKGAKGLNATQISDRFAAMAAPISVNVTSEASQISASTLSRFTPEFLQQLYDVVVHPDFPEAEVARQKELMRAELRRMQDNPGQLVSLEWDPFLYAGHPYAQQPLGQSDAIGKMNRSLVRQHYNQWMGPQNAYLAVVGQYSPDILLQIKSTFGQWKPSQLNQSSMQVPAWIPGRPERKVISRPGITQAEIRIGTPGIARNNPDYLALRLANSAFGEGMGGRLMSRLRVDMGITYGANSHWDARSKAGAFVISFATRTEKIEEGITEAMRLLKELKTKGLTSGELEKAKAQLLGGFSWLVETPEKLVQQLLHLRLFGIEDSYLKTFSTKVKELRLADVNAALARVLEPEQARIMVIKGK